MRSFWFVWTRFNPVNSLTHNPAEYSNLGMLTFDKTGKYLGIYVSKMFKGDLLPFLLKLRDELLGLVVFQHIRKQIPDKLLPNHVDPPSLVK